MTLLVTRPRKQSEVTAKRLSKLGYATIIEPLLEIQQLERPLPISDCPDGLILTSANAVASVRRLWPSSWSKKLEVFTTGEATAKAAKEIGFENISAINGSAPVVAAALAQKYGQSERDSTWLYPHALKTAHNLSDSFSNSAINLVFWPCYQAKSAQSFTPRTREAIENKEISGALLYSARTAETFCKLMDRAGIAKAPPLYVLSEAIFSIIPPRLIQSCVIAQEPNEDALLHLLETSAS